MNERSSPVFIITCQKQSFGVMASPHHLSLHKQLKQGYLALSALFVSK